MKLLKNQTIPERKTSRIKSMDTGNIIAFLKKFSFGRLIGSGIVLRVVIAIVDGIFNLEINELPNFNLYIFALALAYTTLWMFNKSYTDEEE